MSKLYPVQWSDMELLYEWVNDKQVRGASFETSFISREDHKKWFQECMNDKNILIFLLLDRDEKIGQIRVDCNECRAKISYSISEKYRGLGYGKIIIQLVEEELRIIKPNTKHLHAFVKGENIASQKIFRHNGYSEYYDKTQKRYEYDKVVC